LKSCPTPLFPDRGLSRTPVKCSKPIRRLATVALSTIRLEMRIFPSAINRRSLPERSFSFCLPSFVRSPELFTKFTIDRESSRGDVEARGHCAIVKKTRQKTHSLTLPIPSTRIFRHNMRNIRRRYPVSINTGAPSVRLLARRRIDGANFEVVNKP
jgi:hypothetical protein